MSTHNICISREIRKILCGYPLLSVAKKKNTLSGTMDPVSVYDHLVGEEGACDWSSMVCLLLILLMLLVDYDL